MSNPELNKRKRGRPKKKILSEMAESVPIKNEESESPIIPAVDSKKNASPLVQLLASLFRETSDPYSSYLQNEYKKDLNQLNLILSEYLDSYVILGFKPNGKEVVMKKIKNDRDSKALERIIQGFITGQLSFD